jgi:hypothetical protein
VTSRLRRPAGAILVGTLLVGVLGISPAHAVSGGTISGTVTDADGPLEAVSVDAYVLEDGDWTAHDAAFTDGSGEYSLDLPVGTYRIGFNDYGTHVEEFWDDVSTVQEAESIDVTDGGSARADAELVDYSHITGSVTDAAGQGLEGVDVWALVKLGDEWDFVANATTNEFGAYSLDELVEGTYRVEFEAGTSEAPLYEAWNNKGSFEEADDISVGPDTTVTDIDAQLVAGEFDPVPFTLVTEPAISGVQQVGNTLTVTTGTWTPTPETTEIYWFRGQDYTGVSGPSYPLADADAGQVLTVLVQVYGPDGQYDYANATTGPIAAAPAPVVTPPAPVVTPPAPVATPPAATITFPKSMDVTGALKVGSTLKLTKYKAKVSGSTVSYRFQWYAGSKKIKKATKAKLKVTKALKGKKISVKVTAKAGTTTKKVKVKAGKIR